MDGTIYVDDKMIEGAVDTINSLLENKKELFFVTNKTTGSRFDYAEFLKSNGVKNISPDMILTAGDNSIKYFNSLSKRGTFFAIAEERYIAELEKIGFTFSQVPDEIDFIIVTLDRNYSEEKFNIAKSALNKGAKFFAVNVDNTCPVDGGEIIDAGQIIDRLEYESGVKMKKHFGKPSEFMIAEIKNRIKFGKTYLLLGDRLETDIMMGNVLGIDTALVKSGIHNSVDFIGVKPTYILDSVKEILNK